MSTAAAIAIRAATPADADAMAAIYSQGIAEREATFETAERNRDDVLDWLGRDREPVLVATREARVLGFARVIRSSDRCACAGVGEYTIYLDRGARGHGIGRRLLDALAAGAEAHGYSKLIGRLFTGNEARSRSRDAAASVRSASTSATGASTASGRTSSSWSTARRRCAPLTSRRSAHDLGESHPAKMPPTTRPTVAATPATAAK